MQNVHSKNYQEEFSTKKFNKNNQRRELHKQRIRKPELDAIVISSMAKKRLSACVFLPPHAFRRMRFCGHTKFLLFLFLCAHRKKQQTFSVPTKRSPTKNRRKGKTQAERSPIFAMFVLPNTSGHGLFSCQCLELLWLRFAVSIIDNLRTQFFLSTVCIRFSITSHKLV